MHNTITIAIPVFERFDYFPEAIDSALNQTVKCNVIVMDNNSSHNKFEKYVERLNLPNVKYFRNDTNLGMIENWNKCIEYTETDWMTILHDDDLLSLQFLEQVYALINTHADAICVVTGYEKKSKPKLIFEKATPDFIVNRVKPFHFLFGNITGFVGVVFNKSKMGDVKFVPSLYPVSDYDFWYKLSQMQPILYLNKVLSFYRVSPMQDSSTAYKNVIETTYNYRKNHIHFRNSLFKFFSMFELHKLHQRYSKDYNIKQQVHYQIEDINKYFALFSNKAIDYLMSRFIFKVFKRVFKIHTGYR